MTPASDPVVFESGVMPISRPVAEQFLSRQPELPWSAKFVLSCEGEAGLVGEVPRLVEPSRGAGLARQAAERACDWMDEGATQGAERAPGGDAAVLEALLSEAGHPWQALEDDVYRLDVAHGGVVGRMELRSDSVGGLWLCARGAVGVGAGHSFPALARYALEANRQLRVARVSVGCGEGSAAWVVWDAVLPGELPPGPALREGVGAVAAARALTEEALRALAVPSVADAYLSLRTNQRPDTSRRKKR